MLIINLFCYGLGNLVIVCMVNHLAVYIFILYIVCHTNLVQVYWTRSYISSNEYTDTILNFFQYLIWQKSPVYQYLKKNMYTNNTGSLSVLATYISLLHGSHHAQVSSIAPETVHTVNIPLKLYSKQSLKLKCSTPA